jgi:hypothetical protein
MPTGYTYPVVEGKVTEFEDFALSCARAFGALISMRDDAMDAPIPEEIKPDTRYYDERLADDQKRLQEVQAMTKAELDAAASADYAAAIESRNGYIARQSEEAARLNAMMVKVRAWEPPTPDHAEMKRFMIDQLKISLPGEYVPAFPEQLDGATWRQTTINTLAESIVRYQKERDKEIERATNRNGWLKALRASLHPEPKAA